MEKAKIKCTFRDLTLYEAWRLIKRFFSAMLACTLIFILPYVLYILGLRGVDTMFGQKGIYTKWIGYLISISVLLYVLFHIHSVCSGLAELFAGLANLTKTMSGIKRMAFAILLVSYFLGWVHVPTIMFFVSVLFVLPAGFTYDEYMRILRDKQSGREHT